MDGQDAFVVLSYSDKTTLTVVSEGAGSIDAAAAHFKPSDASYVLIRKNHKVEMVQTVKFAFVAWVPESAPPMRKSMLTIHKSQIKDLFLPFHVFLDCTDAADLKKAESQIMDKIGFSSGTKLHVTNKEEYKAPTNLAAQGGVKHAQNKSSNLVSDSVQKNRELGFADKEAFDAAYAAVKSDTDPTDWMLLGYVRNGDDFDIKTLTLLGSGSGGIPELASRLDDEQVYYAYFRLTEQYDKSVTTKFCYLKLMTNKVRPLQRSKMTTHAGFMKEILSPVHVDFDLSAPGDFSESVVREKIGGYTGTKSHVTDKEESVKARYVAERSWDRAHRTSVAGSTNTAENKEASKLKFVDKQAFDAAIAEVRKDSSDTHWVIAVYASKFTLDLLGKGSGGFDEFMGALDEEKACFGLYRTTDVYDGHTTVKFVFVKYQPQNIAPMKRGEISTMSVAIDPCFQPYHVDFFIEARAELTEEQLMAKVKAASGSAIHAK